MTFLYTERSLSVRSWFLLSFDVEELREVVDIYLLTRTDMIDLCLMLACPYMLYIDIHIYEEDVMICHIKKIVLVC